MTSDRDFQLNFVFQAAAEGILLLNAGGYIVRLNPAAAALLELLPNAALEQHAASLFKHRPDLLRLMVEPGEHQAEVTLPHKRLATGIGMDRPGGGRIVLLHDITERAALESRREALIRAIAHDMRNPLNAVAGYADLVGKFGPLTPEQDKFLTRIRQTVQKLYDLSESLIDLAWIEAGMALEHRPIELAHLVRAAVESLESIARERDVIIISSVQDPIPIVIGDPRRLQQMITCLLENAVLYSYPGSNVAIHAWQDGPKVFCSVGDQGIGISATDKEHIWDRLWRSTDDRMRDIPGGGIGLTFARAIIQRHGGQIWVESELNTGSTFTFVLPLAEGW